MIIVESHRKNLSFGGFNVVYVCPTGPIVTLVSKKANSQHVLLKTQKGEKMLIDYVIIRPYQYESCCMNRFTMKQAEVFDKVSCLLISGS